MRERDCIDDSPRSFTELRCTTWLPAFSEGEEESILEGLVGAVGPCFCLHRPTLIVVAHDGVNTR